MISDRALEDHYSRDYYGEGTDYFHPWGWDENGIPLDEPVYDDLMEVEDDEESF